MKTIRNNLGSDVQTSERDLGSTARKHKRAGVALTARVFTPTRLWLRGTSFRTRSIG